MAGIATDRCHRGMAHRICSEALGTVGMAVAALNCAGRDMRRGGHPGCGGSVVAGCAVCVRRLVNIRRTRPTCESGGSSCVADGAILAASWNVTGIRCRTVGAFCSLGGENAIMAGVAAAAAHRRMVHRVGDEARRRVGMAIAALNGP